MSLGNTYAALNQINFFSTPGNSFSAHYHERSAILDSDPPFSRCFVLPMPEEADTANSREMVELAGQFLFRELTSPVGKAADQVRACLPAAWPAHGQTCSTVGLYKVSWPRRELLRLTASACAINWCKPG